MEPKEEEVKEIVEEEKEVITENEDETKVGKEEEVKQFFDPNTVPAELKGAFTKMQGAFTKAMQGLSTEREKVKLYDQLMSGDMEQAVQTLAAKAGLKVTKAGTIEERPGGSEDESPTTKYLRDVVRKEIAPLLDELKNTQTKIAAESLISNLRTNFPDWYLYENEMAVLLTEHPTLRRDPAKLYRLAKAEADEVDVEKKINEKGEKVLTKPSSSRSSVVVTKKAETLEDAFATAKKQLGIKD